MEYETKTQTVPETSAGELYGVLIIGGGFAGLTAALYAGRSGLNTLVLEPQIPGGAITASELVENWPTRLSLSGLELGALLQKQAETVGARLDFGIAARINKIENVFFTTLDSGKTLQSKTVVYAAGVSPRRLGVPGEQEFRGRGVSYCATCDGPFYKNKNVAVIGGGNTAIQEAVYLSSLAKTVTVVHRRAAFRAEKIILDRARSRSNIVFKTPCTVEAITGAENAAGLRLRNVLSGETESLSCAGVFIYAGIEPNTRMLKDFVRLTADGFVAAGEDTRTNVPGFFAAGDVRSKELRQLVTAAADGAVAAVQAAHYLENSA
ncbi:MAG: FAD-dependent oxidoreductase [Candidatus Margulisbacteria bacterium]|jgi:thioredoxin reductase (NADPH)|nr:FAD-dependent oxidoreductase [Candidatus Margulisiibacteriota bacterium]